MLAEVVWVPIDENCSTQITVASLSEQQCTMYAAAGNGGDVNTTQNSPF